MAVEGRCGNVDVTVEWERECGDAREHRKGAGVRR